MIKIGTRPVGDDALPYTVAEIGCNHGGSVERASRMIEAAADAGATAVKFQYFRVNHLTQDREERQRLMPLCLTLGAMRQLRKTAAEQYLAFIITPFGVQEAEEVASLNPDAVKIASPDITWKQLIYQAAKASPVLILSTGGARPDMIDAAIRTARKARRNGHVIGLHAVCAYPCSLQQSQLFRLPRLARHDFDVIGLSDHSPSSSCGEAAVAAYVLGARVWERHFALDGTEIDGPCSSLPASFATTCRALRELRTALLFDTDREDWVSPATLARTSRHVVTARELPKGHVLAEDDVLCVRPSGPTAPADLAMVVGSTLRRAHKQYQAIRLGNLARRPHGDSQVRDDVRQREPRRASPGGVLRGAGRVKGRELQPPG